MKGRTEGSRWYNTRNLVRNSWHSRGPHTCLSHVFVSFLIFSRSLPKKTDSNTTAVFLLVVKKKKILQRFLHLILHSGGGAFPSHRRCLSHDIFPHSYNYVITKTHQTITFKQKNHFVPNKITLLAGKIMT